MSDRTYNRVLIAINVVTLVSVLLNLAVMFAR